MTKHFSQAEENLFLDLHNDLGAMVNVLLSADEDFAKRARNLAVNTYAPAGRSVGYEPTKTQLKRSAEITLSFDLLSYLNRDIVRENSNEEKQA